MCILLIISLYFPYISLTSSPSVAQRCQQKNLQCGFCDVNTLSPRIWSKPQITSHILQRQPNKACGGQNSNGPGTKFNCHLNKTVQYADAELLFPTPPWPNLYYHLFRSGDFFSKVTTEKM